ncbi:MAG: D-alanyl-D-alanine carboxypeptidase/D-alanyl-D-alanine-endopeptidase [Hyphomonadaceae bacterium]
MRVFLTAFAMVVLSACATLSDRAASKLSAPELAGTRFGLVVMTMDGRELVSINPDQRFLPASNTKIFTVAAAFHRLGDLTLPDPRFGTSVRLVPRGDGEPPDVVLVGAGDAMLLDAPDCERDCLSALADAVVTNKVTRVNDIIADDRLFPNQPWGQGWSWDDLVTRSGAAVSALTVNSNEVGLVIRPGANVGDPADEQWRQTDVLGGQYFFDLQNEIVTVAPGDDVEDSYLMERLPDTSVLRLNGHIVQGGAARNLPVAVASPVGAAAWRLQYLLEQRGVKMAGTTVVTHRPVAASDYPALRKDAPIPPLTYEGFEIGRLLPPPLIEDATFLMKQSQNLHAELLLRRLGLLQGGGSAEDGLAVVEAMLTEAGAPRWAWDFSDGSGMSVYNRVTPHMVAEFLRWTSQRPWGQAFRDTFPVGGVDGTLRRRFTGTSLEGRVFAKTGTLAGTNALSGFMLTKSGQTLIFSAYANDRPSSAESATAALDATLVEIAETN